jgi:hypothetical protein
MANGGRGWNRTTNLSIKSRMLCQLSYASVKAGKGRRMARRTSPDQAQAKYNIIAGFGILEGEGEAALNRALILGKIQGASIAGEERAIPLGQQIANVDKGFCSVGK